MKILSLKQIIAMHFQLLDETGGASGVRDTDLLESAICAPFQSFDGTDAYPALHQKAARLCYGIVKNHPFIDGNKRIGAHSMLVFLALNSIELSYTQQELIDIITNIASGQAACDDLAAWILTHEM